MIAVEASSISVERQTYNFLERLGDGPIVRADGEQVLDGGVRCDSGVAPPFEELDDDVVRRLGTLEQPGNEFGSGLGCAVVQRDHLAGIVQATWVPRPSAGSGRSR